MLLISLSPLGHSAGFASCKARCVLVSASLPNCPLPQEGGEVRAAALDLLRGFAPQPRSGLLCGINGATAPSPSKDACSQSHKAVMQGCIKTATQSRYARMHKDSHTKPLHDATAQMAVIAQMQRHKWLSMHRRNDTNG